MSRRTYRTSAVEYARAALARGPLIEWRTDSNATHYRFGRRLFSSFTVARLIEAGEAVRDGNMVRAA